MAALALDLLRTPCPEDGPRRAALVLVEPPADDALVELDGVPANDGQYPVRPTYHYDSAPRKIRYEEYHPYGTSAYRAVDASVDVSAKRYRYTGMERDEETGLGYHSARYYAPWLGRWTASDPIGLGDGVNRYAYVGGNPTTVGDPNGLAPPVTLKDLQDQRQVVADRRREATRSANQLLDESRSEYEAAHRAFQEASRNAQSPEQLEAAHRALTNASVNLGAAQDRLSIISQQGFAPDDFEGGAQVIKLRNMEDMYAAQQAAGELAGSFDEGAFRWENLKQLGRDLLENSLELTPVPDAQATLEAVEIALEEPSIGTWAHVGEVSAPLIGDAVATVATGAVIGGKIGAHTVDELAEKYGRAVSSNRPWSWKVDIGLDVTESEARAVRSRAIELGLVTDVPMKPGTRFPDFEAVGLVRSVDTLPESMWKASDKTHFAWLDARLPGGRRPEGMTWHHSEIPGRMELVEFGPHNIVNHRGGRSPGQWAHVTRR